MEGHDLRRYRAERLLARDFHALRPKIVTIVRSKLSPHGVTLDGSDLEACYAQAWHALYAALLEGRGIEDHAAWLVEVTFRRAIDDARPRIRRSTDLAGDAQARDDRSVREADLAGELAERARVRQLLEAMRAGLTARERKAVTLCYLHGLSRAEAAGRMGISEERMRKLMDGSRGRQGLARKFGLLLDELRAGSWCERQASLMRAHALGLHDPQGERHRLALAHLRECPSCRAFVACLRGLAVVLPPLPLPVEALPAPVGRAVGRARGAARARGGAAAEAAKGGALLKLGSAGALVLGATGYAVLALSAPAHPARVARPPTSAPAPIAASTGAQPVWFTQHDASAHRLSRHGASAHRGSPHGASPHRNTHARPIAQAPAVGAGSLPASVQRGASASQAPGEFTPERPSR